MTFSNKSKLTNLPDLNETNFQYDGSTLIYKDLTKKATTYINVIDGYLNIKHEAKDAITQAHSLALTLQAINGPIIPLQIDSSDLGNAKKLETLVNNYGIIVYSAKYLRLYLQTLLSQLKSAQHTPRLAVSALGWSPAMDLFNTGRQLLLPASADSDEYLHKPATGNAYMTQSGTLKQWQREIFKPVAQNPIALGAMCLGLSALLYDKLSIPMGIVNYYGAAGTGKTLLLQTTGSQFGNSSAPDQVSPNAMHPGYIRKFNCTSSGFEVMAGEYLGIPLLLDELGEADQAMLANLIYTLSSGQGKNRSTSALKSAQNLKWQTAMISVGEISMQSAITGGKKMVMDGQLDRCADIAIDNTSGIFTQFGKHESFQGLTRHLKQATGQYYGTPAIVFIEWLLANPDAVDKLQESFNEIVEHFAPEGCEGGSLRIMHRFAAALIAGNLAVEAGIYTCSAEDIENAILMTINAWWQAREWDLKLLAEFVIDNKDQLGEGKVTRAAVPGFIVDNDTLLVIPKEAFEQYFGDMGKQLLASLTKRKLLIIEQKGRLLSRHCNHSVFGYAIKFEPIAKKIEQIEGL